VNVTVTGPAEEMVRRVRAGGRENLIMVLGTGCCDSTSPFLYDNYLPEPDAQPVGAIDGVTIVAPKWLAELYPGDEGFPSGQTGLNKQWTNFSPRVGVAWDVTGDGRMALRASYALAYDFMTNDYHQINSSAPPFGNRSLITDPVCLFDDPYCGRDPHPITTNANTEYPAFGPFGHPFPSLREGRLSLFAGLVAAGGSRGAVAADEADRRTYVISRERR